MVKCNQLTPLPLNGSCCRRGCVDNHASRSERKMILQYSRVILLSVERRRQSIKAGNWGRSKVSRTHWRTAEGMSAAC